MKRCDLCGKYIFDGQGHSCEIKVRSRCLTCGRTFYEWSRTEHTLENGKQCGPVEEAK